MSCIQTNVSSLLKLGDLEVTTRQIKISPYLFNVFVLVEACMFFTSPVHLLGEENIKMDTQEVG